jgi:sterol desaturase/sphingolipid hydroxylase (fatty acid hydroxylase superfamily)
VIPELLAPLLAGFLFWGLLEYAIHGALAHRWRSFVAPLHRNHHRDPQHVFSSPFAVLPVALLLFGAAALVASPRCAAAFVGGTFAGFCRYEWMHWRFHFRAPRSARERLLRSHHLAHHFCDSRAYHGVTSRFWDRVFGTLPAHADRDYARVADLEPLRGASNLAAVWNPTAALALLRRARAADRFSGSCPAAASSARRRSTPGSSTGS